MTVIDARSEADVDVAHPRRVRWREIVGDSGTDHRNSDIGARNDAFRVTYVENGS